MAVNPGEEIVNVWLQDCCGFFTRQNVNVKKRKGGRGKEIDILGINREGKRVWCEVSVSANPRIEKTDDPVKRFTEKFCDEKAKEVAKIFGTTDYEKRFVYSHRIFRKKSDQEAKFKQKMQENGINCFSFQDILNKTITELDHYSVDPTRVYLYYLKFFAIDG